MRIRLSQRTLKIKLRFLVMVCAVVGLAMGSTSAATESLAGSRPNIVLIMPDDVSYGSIGAYGGKNASPHVDAFFHKSLRFEDFHVSPTCAPTRAALLTGRHEFYAGVTHTIVMRDRMSLQSRTLAEMLRDAGYTTGIFGKWHLGDAAEYRPESRGFDEVYIHGAGGIGQNFPHSADFPNNNYNNPVLYHNGKAVETTGYCTDLFFGQATQWLQEVSAADKPFFCYIPLNVNHGPFIRPILPDGSKGNIMENLDDNVGKFMEFLDNSGLSKQTLVIYMTDNGANSGEKQLRGGKTSAYEGGTRVPSMFYWQGKIEGGIECHHLTGHLDYFATFAELAGSDEPVPGGKPWDGRSLVPLLENPKADWPQRYWIAHRGRWRDAATSQYRMGSIRNAQHKVVYPGKGDPELYDLEKDMREQNNISGQHSDIEQELQAVYDEWWQDVQAYLVNDNLQDAPETHKPFHDIYRRDFGEEKFQAAMKAMDWVGGSNKKTKKKN